MAQPTAILVLGVSGSGKTTISGLLAGRLGWELADADDFHPPANIEKMRSGTPLTDEDRWPWLEAIAAYVREIRAAGKQIETHTSPGVDHAFFNDERPEVHDPAASGDAWERTLRFLRQHLGGP